MIQSHGSRYTGSPCHYSFPINQSIHLFEIAFRIVANALNVGNETLCEFSAMLACLENRQLGFAVKWRKKRKEDRDRCMRRGFMKQRK